MSKEEDSTKRSIKISLELEETRLSQLNKPTKRQRTIGQLIIGWIIIFMSLTGGVLFTVGSIAYWPSLNYGLFGAVCFIIGSVEYTLCEVLAVIIEPALAPWRIFKSLAALKVLFMMLGNLSFIIGSVFFIPSMKQIVGIDIFIIGSNFMWIPQILACWGIYINTPYNSEFYYSFSPWKRTVLAMNICMFFACMCFIVGTVLFKNGPIEDVFFNDEGVALFIAGSALFLLAGIIGLKMRKERLVDPLQEHHDRIRNIYAIA